MGDPKAAKYLDLKLRIKLLALIKERGMKQSDLAKGCGMHPKSISLICQGRRRLYLEESPCVAKALRVPLAYLADDSLDSPPDFGELSAPEEVAISAIRTHGYTSVEVYKRMDPNAFGILVEERARLKRERDKNISHP